MYTSSRRALAAALVLAALPVAAIVAPARAWAAAPAATVEASYACTYLAGVRRGQFVIRSTFDTPAVVKALSVSPARDVLSRPALGATVEGTQTAAVEFSDSAGASSISLSVTLHWDSRSDQTARGPVDQQLTSTVYLNPCQPKPSAVLVSRCDGTVEVVLGNGAGLGATAVGGTAVFVVTAAGGFLADAVAVNPGGQRSVVVPREDASAIVVRAPGMSTVRGGYLPPRCSGYPPPVNGKPGDSVGVQPEEPLPSGSPAQGSPAQGTPPGTSPSPGVPSGSGPAGAPGATAPGGTLGGGAGASPEPGYRALPHVPVPPDPGSRGWGGTVVLLLIGASIAVVLGASALVVRRWRQAAQS